LREKLNKRAQQEQQQQQHEAEVVGEGVAGWQGGHASRQLHFGRRQQKSIRMPGDCTSAAVASFPWTPPPPPTHQMGCKANKTKRKMLQQMQSAMSVKGRGWQRKGSAA